MSESKPYQPYTHNSEGTLTSHQPSPRGELNGWGHPGFGQDKARDAAEPLTIERATIEPEKDVK